MITTSTLILKNGESITELIKNNVTNDSWYFVHIGIYNEIKYKNIHTYIASGTVGFEFEGNSIIEFDCINSISPLWVVLSRYTNNKKVEYYKPLSPENIVFIKQA